jgi:Protein of unknown function (DUF3667)
MTCQSCGNPNQEKFCPNCGEKRFDPHSLTLKHVVEESVEGFTHADHNFIRTISSLLFRPGRLATEYVNGRRIDYMKPLGLFLVINLLFFLLAAVNAFSQPLSSYLQYKNYTIYGTEAMVNSALIRTGQNLEQFSRYFNEAMVSNSKSLIILLIPIYALIFAILMWHTHRKFIEHLVFATHFVSFVLIYLLFHQLFISRPFVWLFGDEAWRHYGDAINSLFGLFMLGLYLFVGFRKFYGVGRIWALTTALTTAVLFAFVLLGYRMLMFYKIVLLAH